MADVSQNFTGLLFSHAKLSNVLSLGGLLDAAGSKNPLARASPHA